MKPNLTAVLALAVAAPLAGAQPVPQPGAPSPRRTLAAADEAVGEARTLSFSVRVEHIGAVALDQPSLELDVKAMQDGGAWRFVAEGRATDPDGVGESPLALWTDGQTTWSLDAARSTVYEADGGAAMALMNEAGVFPAVFWFVLWDGLVSAQLEDAGTDLPMTAAGSRLVDGVECQAVRVDYTRQRNELGGVYDVWWFIDPATSLPARIEACYFRRDQNAYGFTILSISDLRVDPAISDTDLTPDVPEGVLTEAYALPDLGDSDMAGPAIGATAPDWTLKDGDGVEHSLRDYRGSIVVMDFWASWCGPCLAAMPGLQRLHEQYQGKPVHILGLNMSEPLDPVEFMRENGWTYGLMVEADDVANTYEVQGIPSIFAVGPDGKIIFRAGGYSPDLEEKLAAAIERALPAATPAEAEDQAGAEDDDVGGGGG
jgi:thiol-disulfide isomerase/thioredoxin